MAQLVTTAHMVLVQHAFCSLDGEAVDAPRSARPSAPCAHSQDVDSLGTAHDEPAIDAHNHCELAVDRSSRLALAPALAVVVQASALVESVRWDGQTLAHRSYTGDARPIYHRCEQLLDEDHPRHAYFPRLTAREQAAGLLGRPDLGTVGAWRRAKGS